MKTIVLYFQIHQPRRLKPFSYFDIGTGAPYFDDELDRQIIGRVAADCYLPGNALLLQLIKENPQVRICFSVSGMALEQFRDFPEVIASFKALIATGAVEILCETSHHSLASEMPGDEFEQQVTHHRALITKYFDVSPRVFRNTELIYSNGVADRVSALGFDGILTDGTDQLLGARSTYQLFCRGSLTIIPRSYRLSDDIGFRFRHNDSTLTAAQYIQWLQDIPENENFVTIGIDYETFGEHQKKDTGIFNFLKNLIESIAVHPGLEFQTPSGLLKKNPHLEPLDVPVAVSWADSEKDLSAWLGNSMQREAFDMIQKVGSDVIELNDAELLEWWRCLQTSDHLYYMSTKHFGDGSVHSYFSPYNSPYEAFINYMNVLADFEIQIGKRKLTNSSTPEVLVERERRETIPEPVWVETIKENYYQPHISN